MRRIFCSLTPAEVSRRSSFDMTDGQLTPGGPMQKLRKLIPRLTPERLSRKSLLIKEIIQGVDFSRVVKPEEVGLDPKYVVESFPSWGQISCSTPERSPRQQSGHHSGYWLRKRQRHVGHAQIPFCEGGWHRNFQGDQ